MSRPKIKTALPAILILLGAIFVLFAVFAINRLGAINDNVTDIATNSLPTVEAVKDMEVQVSEIRTAYRSHILRSDAEGKAAAAKSIDGAVATLKADLGKYQNLGPIAEEARLATLLEKSMADYVRIGVKVISLSNAGNIDEANKVLRDEMVGSADDAKKALSRMVEIANQTTQEAYLGAGAEYRRTFYIALTAIAFLSVVIAASILFAITGIARPIERITQSMGKLAQGDADSAIPYGGRADEIGEMAGAVEVFRANALETRRLEQETAAQRAQSEDERQRNAELEKRRAEAMAQATTSLAEGLKNLAGGNLLFELDKPFAADFETLRSDFNQAIVQLRGTLATVSDATGSIDGGAREVSQSADDLSKRTEQQAASLEETAAALDEITTNVANSSKRADEARTVAVQANESARHSGQVVANAVDAMGKIEQSSAQISSIIGVIDEIAFQTNLLALNAGVEAARAGEAGKGFAVVAQEVRELAQRSAKAAKEIKELIRNSSAEVSNGVQLVTETGNVLKTIEQHIVTINRHMDAIATSSREQSLGLAEVNTAVNQMDQVTQQNAAMVEEASAAGMTLASEAGRLRQLISQFRLGNTAAAAATPNVQARRPASVGAKTPPHASPARGMIDKVARAYAGGAAPKARADDWEEF